MDIIKKYIEFIHKVFNDAYKASKSKKKIKTKMIYGVEVVDQSKYKQEV